MIHSRGLDASTEGEFARSEHEMYRGASAIAVGSLAVQSERDEHWHLAQLS